MKLMVVGKHKAGATVRYDLEIADNTVSSFDPITSSAFPNYSGWVGKVYLPGITNLGGALDASQLTINVTDPGFDATGAVTTVSRTIKGVAHVRRQQPNGASKCMGPLGAGIQIYISLSDWIYSGTTIVSATIGATFYAGYAGSTCRNIKNSSNVAYPKCGYAALNPQHERSSGTFAYEFCASSRFARGGRQIACAKVVVTDGTTTVVSAAIAATTLSTKVTNTGVQTPEVYACTVDFSTMTQAAVCQVYPRLYPWIGDSYTDVKVDGEAWPTSLPMTPLRVVCDRTGGYGGVYAYVDGIGGGTPAVSTVAATARTTPYASVSAAMTAITTYNNANKGHNDFGGGTIRLMDLGAPKTYAHAISPTNTPGSALLDIEPDPLNGFTITNQAGANSRNYPSNIRWRAPLGGPAMAWTATGTYNYEYSGINTETTSVMVWDNMTVAGVAAIPLTRGWAYQFYLNLTIMGTSLNDLNSTSGVNAAANVALLAGCKMGVTNNSSPIGLSYAHAVIANDINNTGNNSRLLSSESAVAAGGSTDGDHWRFIYNNKYYSMSLDIGGTLGARTLRGAYTIIQNLVENSATGAMVMKLFADNDLTTCTNIIMQCNTLVGDRINYIYNDSPGSAALTTTQVAPSGVQKICSLLYNIVDGMGQKSDRSISPGFGGVGNWASAEYHVGSRGNVGLCVNIFTTTDLPHNDNSQTPYYSSAWVEGSPWLNEPNLRRGGATAATIAALFTSWNTSIGGAGAITRPGDYRPKSTSTTLKSRVAAGEGVLIYDLAGATRKTDGTGAAGAFEAVP